MLSNSTDAGDNQILSQSDQQLSAKPFRESPRHNPDELDWLEQLATRLETARSGMHREILCIETAAYHLRHPVLGHKGFVRDFNAYLHFRPRPNLISVCRAGPLNVVTHACASCKGNPKGIVATALNGDNAMSWTEGKMIFAISNRIESAARNLMRLFSAEQKHQLSQIVALLVQEQLKAKLHVPTIFRSQQPTLRKSQEPVAVEDEALALLTRCLVNVSHCQNQTGLINETLTRARQIAGAQPSLMSALSTDAFDSLIENYPGLSRDLLPGLLSEALNLVTRSDSFSAIAGSHPDIVVLRRRSLAWRLNPSGNFAVQLGRSGDSLVDFAASKLASMLETLLRNSLVTLDRTEHSKEFMEALCDSVTFLSKVQRPTIKPDPG